MNGESDDRAIDEAEARRDALPLHDDWEIGQDRYERWLDRCMGEAA